MAKIDCQSTLIKSKKQVSRLFIFFYEKTKYIKIRFDDHLI